MPKAIRKKCTSCGTMYGCHKGTPGDLGGKCAECVAKDMMYFPGPGTPMAAPLPAQIQVPVCFEIKEPKEATTNNKKITIKTNGESTITIE